MKYKNFLLIGFFVILSLVYTWYESNRPRPVDWSETYSPEDKIPYGTYIVRRSLEQLFPGAEISTSRLSFYEAIECLDTVCGSAYIFIDRVFNPDPVAAAHLLDWVQAGNELFIAAEAVPDTLLSMFALKMEYNYEHLDSELVFKGAEEKSYPLYSSGGNYFLPKKKFVGEVLGRKVDGRKADFVRVPYGKGKVYINLNPRGFTNRYALDSVCGDYYYRALSLLAPQRTPVVWDAHQTLGRQSGDTPFRVILRYPPLHSALYLLICGVLCYVLFRVKREQRPIPVVEMPRNRMLEFIATVSSLYYRQKEHRTIALKQIDFFLGEIRRVYYLHTDRLDEQFVRLLSERSGVHEQKTARVIALVRDLRTDTEVTQEQLTELMKGTELFIRKMRHNE